MGERSAARTDFNHVDHRDRNGHTRPLFEPVGAGNFKNARRLGSLIFDQANLGGGPAHVERQHLIQPVLRSDMRGKDSATRRTGFNQAHWKVRRILDRDDATARVH